MSNRSTAQARVVVRSAEPSDLETIVEFNRRLAEETEGKRLDLAVLREGVRAVLTQPRRGRYFLACVDGRVVGQVMHTWEWSDWRCGEIWWLQSVYVLPAYRRQGVLRQLLEHVFGLAERDRQVVGVRLYVEQSNQVAQLAYSKLGFEPAGYVVLERMLAERVSGPDSPPDD